jgi:hypothetical protein
VKIPLHVFQQMPDIEIFHPHAVLFGQAGGMILVGEPAALRQLKRLDE